MITEIAKRIEHQNVTMTGDAEELNSHQANNTRGFALTNAFMLSKNKTTLFVVSASEKKYLDHFKAIWTETGEAP